MFEAIDLLEIKRLLRVQTPDYLSQYREGVITQRFCFKDHRCRIQSHRYPLVLCSTCTLDTTKNAPITFF